MAVRRGVVSIIAAAIALSACGLVPANTSMLGDGIYFEPGAQSTAIAVSRYLPQALAQVQDRHQREFRRPPRIYLFSSERQFDDQTGFNATRVAAVSKPGGLYFAPQPFAQLAPVMVHELSHVMLRQWTGPYAFYRVPTWFREGLATWVADGGGAQDVALQFPACSVHEPVEGHLVALIFVMVGESIELDVVEAVLCRAKHQSHVGVS